MILAGIYRDECCDNHLNYSRSDNYGATFTNIESNLDPDHELDPLLWVDFYISPTNKNIVSDTSSYPLTLEVQQ